MREGYKVTELGEIPETWSDFTFEKCVKFSGGAQPPRNTFVFEPTEGYVRLIQTRDYRTDKFKTYIPKVLARKFCVSNDIMIGRYGPPIFQIFRGMEGAYNVALVKAIPNEIILDKDYLFFYISQYEIWAFVENLSQRSGGQTGVDIDQLKKYPFPLPSLPEQKKIALILMTVDEKIENINAQIIQMQELKKGLMQQLLTKGIGHTKFKSSELGNIPKSWEVVKLSEVGKIISGGTPDTKNSLNWNGNIPWCTPTDITGLKGKKNIYNTKKTISEIGLKTSSATLLPENSLIVCTRATIGDCAINKFPITTNQGFKSIVPNNNWSVDFLYYLINSIKDKIIRLSSGSTFLEISKKAFENIAFAAPSYLEQQKIAEILSSVDEKLDSLQIKKQSYKQLKKGLMQQLLTGKIRVQTSQNEPSLV